MNRLASMGSILLLMILTLLPETLGAYRVLYAEQFYRLYHRHLYEDQTRTIENIHWLEQALRADFANPLNALARINTPQEWERYRYLFYTHVSLALVEQYLQLGRNFDKQVAYFYNAPWRQENLNSLERAEEIYEFARNYWTLAQEWSERAAALPFIHLQDIQYWTDQSHRIETGDLDYEFIIDRHLNRLRQVRADFLAMDENTY